MDNLNELLHASALKGGYVPAGTEDTARSQALFERLLRSGPDDVLGAEFDALGFTLGTLQLAGETLSVVSETPGARTGKGVYVVRPPGAAAVALEAPHQFKDLDTGTLAARLLAAGPFAAAAWNTVPRWYDQDGRRVDADLAHTEISHFNAFTRAVGAVHGNGLLIQLHGFEAGNRKSEAGAAADVIVSGGRRDPGPQVRARDQCLRTAFDWKVLLFGRDVDELGGTKNANAAALRQAGATEFLHLELSRPTRRALVADVGMLETFAQCLLGRGP